MRISLSSKPAGWAAQVMSAANRTANTAITKTSIFFLNIMASSFIYDRLIFVGLTVKPFSRNAWQKARSAADKGRG
jgi:hypothetical protein